MHANLGQLRLSSLLLYSGSLLVFPTALSLLLSLSRTFFPLSFPPFSFFSPSVNSLLAPPSPSRFNLPSSPSPFSSWLFYHSRCTLFYFFPFFILLSSVSLWLLFSFSFFLSFAKFYFYSLSFFLANCFSFFLLCSLFVSYYLSSFFLSFFPFLFASLFFLSPRSSATHDLFLFIGDTNTETNLVAHAHSLSSLDEPRPRWKFENFTVRFVVTIAFTVRRFLRIRSFVGYDPSLGSEYVMPVVVTTLGKISIYRYTSYWSIISM